MSESCDKCGKRVDCRSMTPVGSNSGKVFYVCLACHGYFDEVELLDSMEPGVDHSTSSD